MNETKGENMKHDRKYKIIIVSIIEAFFIVSIIMTKLDFRYLHISNYMLFSITFLLIQLPVLLVLLIRKKGKLTSVLITILIPISIMSSYFNAFSFNSETHDLNNYLYFDNVVDTKSIEMFPDKEIFIRNKAQYTYILSNNIDPEYEICLELTLDKVKFYNEEKRIQEKYIGLEKTEITNGYEYRISYEDDGVTYDYKIVRFMHGGNVQYIQCYAVDYINKPVFIQTNINALAGSDVDDL